MPGIMISLFAVWPPVALHVSALALAGIPALPWPVRAAAIFGAAILILDVAARLRDFRKVARDLKRDPELLSPHVARYKRSWCQRTVIHWAAFAALGTAGSKLVRQQFETMGYRWFHIFPDRTFTRESPFLRINFWRSLIGGTPEIRRDLLREPAE